MILRPYQQRVLDDLWDWFQRRPDGNPIVEAAVGAGKSLMIAALAKRADAEHPGTRVLVLVHQKELLEQNLEKILAIWPQADVGIYSASAKRKELGRQITYATIGSIYKLAFKLGRIDIVLADECFVAGTKVATLCGSKNIEDVRPGDVVFNATGAGVVRAVSARTSGSIYKVRTSDGRVVKTTANHPFLTSSGWVRARDLERGARLSRLEDMPALWGDLQASRLYQQEGLDGVPEQADIRKGAILLDLLLKEEGERDVDSRREGADGIDTEVDRASAVHSWWQRHRLDAPAGDDAQHLGGRMVAGTAHQDGNANELRVPAGLQGGHREYHNAIGHRTGRAESLWGPLRAGQEEGCAAGFPWVESVEVEERGCAEVVFNLDVSGHPSYFADGVLVHNCHLINPRMAGMWRKFLADLSLTCPHARTIGWTGTPFRGNGVWLTASDDPLFQAIAAQVRMRELLDLGFLAPLLPAATVARIDTDDVRTAGDDYVVSELAAVTDRQDLVEATCSEIVSLAADRKRWLVFAVTIAHAEHVAEALRARGVAVGMVSAETPAQERAGTIAAFRAGGLRCLVNVAVLTTGFDVPQVDFIALLRATKSPVLYVQIAGRGMRLAPGKTDCLWADFTDTTDRLGPVDAIVGQGPKPKGQAPTKHCEFCGAIAPASAKSCENCHALFPPPKEPDRIKHGAQASAAAILSGQEPKIEEFPVDRVRYSRHDKPGGPPTLRVEYCAGLLVAGREWVCLSHEGYARRRAEMWWATRSKIDAIPGSVDAAMEWLTYDESILRRPVSIRVAKMDKYPQVVSYEWSAT